MKPYYSDNHVTIYHGDNKDVIPILDSGCFDLMLTDPPYGINWQSGRRKVKHDKIAGDQCFCAEMISNLIACMARGSYVFGRWENLRVAQLPKSVVVWVKPNHSAGDLKHEHGRKWEAIFWYPGPDHRFVSRPPDVMFCPTTGNKLHPTQKPIGLCVELMLANEFETVIDPYAGSGTIGRAAKDLGKKAVLIECDERYCEIAARRMSQEVFPFEFNRRSA